MSVQAIGIQTQEPQSSINFAKIQSQVVCVALRALEVLKKVAYHAALLVGKAIAIPIELSVIAILAAATALSMIFSRPVRYTVEGEEKLKLYHHLVATLDDLCEFTMITLKYGLHRESESLQYADQMPHSPQFAKVEGREVKGTAILYAPGYLDSPATMRDTARRLAEQTKSPVYIVKYRSLFQSIEEHAKDVARVQARIAKDTGRKDIVLVGHSMGGLSTGRFIQQMEPDAADIKLWITIGSPLKGCDLAEWGFGKCARDMRYGSEFLKKFNQQSRLDDVPALHIHTLTDLIVPVFSAKREGSPRAENYMCKEPRGHLGVRSCPEIEDRITNAVRHAI